MSKPNFKGHDFDLKTRPFGIEVYSCNICGQEISIDDHKQLMWGKETNLLKCRGANYHVNRYKVKIIQHPNGYMFSVPAATTNKEIEELIESTKGQRPR